MRKIITIGESVLDTIYSGNQPVRSFVGGRIANVAARISHAFGEAYGLSIEREKGRYTRVPQRTKRVTVRLTKDEDRIIRSFAGEIQCAVSELFRSAAIYPDGMNQVTVVYDPDYPHHPIDL